MCPPPVTPSSGAPSGSSQGQWAPENRSQVDQYIREAYAHAEQPAVKAQYHGDVQQAAFAYLRDLRQQPAHYYDTNMAIAADYLRARWDTEQFGPDFERTEIRGYLDMKRSVGAPKEGPGPVSPYSELEAEYMYKGVTDQVNSQSPEKNREQHSLKGEVEGAARGVWSSFVRPGLSEAKHVAGTLVHDAEHAASTAVHGAEHVASSAVHGAENAGGKVLKIFHL